MPSTYAHYRFGAQLLAALPPELQRSARRFRQLYDMGLHGPDIFFYDGVLPKPHTGKLGFKHHCPSGKIYFQRACRYLRLHPSEGATAYLCGVLAHYALDSLSHPYIQRMSQQHSLSPTAIETEFDRFLLELDGKKPPHQQDLSMHLRLTEGECETAAAFYPGISAGTVSRCVKNMSKLTRNLAQGSQRSLTAKTLRLAGREAMGLMMPVQPDPVGAKLAPSLMRLYELAMNRYPVLLDQILEHLRRNTPLGPDFSAIFG